MFPNARSLMTPDCMLVDCGRTLGELQREAGAAPLRDIVVTDEGVPVGVLSLAHLSRNLIESPDATRIGDLVHGRPLLVTPESTIVELLAGWAAHLFTRAIVVEGDTVVGTISANSLRPHAGLDTAAPVAA